MLEEVKNCIRTPPVYLGELYFTDKPIPSSQMYHRVIDEAANWTKDDFKRTPLKNFFCSRGPGVKGYRLKPDYDCEVDHLIPKNMGGRDHPSNYAFMSSHLNTSYSDRHLDEKFATMPEHVRRKAYEFARNVNKATDRAFRDYLKTLAPPVGAKKI